MRREGLRTTEEEVLYQFFIFTFCFCHFLGLLTDLRSSRSNRNELAVSKHLRLKRASVVYTLSNWLRNLKKLGKPAFPELWRDPSTFTLLNITCWNKPPSSWFSPGIKHKFQSTTIPNAGDRHFASCLSPRPFAVKIRLQAAHSQAQEYYQ